MSARNRRRSAGPGRAAPWHRAAAVLWLVTASACAVGPSEGFEPTDEPADEYAEEAIAWRYLGPAGVDRARSVEGLSLGGTNVRLPNDAVTGASLARSAFDAELLPLRSPHAWFTDAGPVRTREPTTVRVVLDRIESLQPGLVVAGAVSRLGDAERLTLLEGDRLEVTVWAGNYTGGRDPVILGVSLGGRDVTSVLDGVRVGAALGGGAVRTVINPGVLKRGVFFAQRLGAGQHGGFMLTGTVRRPPMGAPSWSIDAQAAAAFGNQEVDRDEAITVERALAVYRARGSAARTHQQGQFFGWYEGEGVANAGRTLSIAAPGSWGYHGTAYESASAEARAAAYWVPLRVRLRAGTARPRAFDVVTATGQWVDPNAVSVLAREPGRSFVTVRAGSSVRFVDEMDLQVTFLGTSATELGLRFR